MSIWGQDGSGLRRRALERIIRSRFILAAAAFITALILGVSESWWLSFAVLMIVLVSVVVVSAALPRTER